MNKRIIDTINFELKKKIKKNSFIFGQNLTKGSRIAGLTNFLDKIKKSKIINTQNSENTLIGFGFGLSLMGKTAIYFAKQLDFLLLGMDHIVNTLNSLKLEKKNGNFSIITYIVDSGYEGPQSRFHCLQEVGGISKAKCVYLVFPDDIAFNLKKINTKLFSIFCISQKYSRLEYKLKSKKIIGDGDVFKYNDGDDATIVSMGFSSYYVYDKIIKKTSSKFDFFVITNPSSNYIREILLSIKKTKKVLLFDDSRSMVKNVLSEIEMKARKQNKNIKINKYYKSDKLEDLFVNEDKYQPEINI